MRILVNDEVLGYEYNSIKELDVLWKQVTREIYKKNEVIHYIEVNNQKISINFEQYIINNFDAIAELKVFTISEQQLLLETIEETNKYVSNVLNEIESISEFFYRDKRDGGWNKFADFIQGLEWIYSTIQSSLFLIDKHSMEIIADKEKLLHLKDKLDLYIHELEKALNQKDYITVSDLIEYEFKPILIELLDLFTNVRMN